MSPRKEKSLENEDIVNDVRGEGKVQLRAGVAEMMVVRETSRRGKSIRVIKFRYQKTGIGIQPAAP